MGSHRLPICLGVWVLLGLAAGGCSRAFYRTQANWDAYELIAEKETDPRWQLQQYTVEVDPRSRYYDPYDPDCPPMPEDDPASHEFMHWVDGMRGWKGWHGFGQRVDLENPFWREQLREYVAMTEEDEVVLTLESSVMLTYIHSPDYQNQVETLFLSSLDVSTERFRLDSQFFGGLNTTFTHNGSNRGPGGETNTLAVGRGAGAGGGGFGGAANLLQMNRRFATAGQLLVGFANSFVWEFTGGDTNVTSSILNLNLVQPLLRGAGRDIALEQLTIVERGLLANLRAFQRYREGLYTNVAIGSLGVQGPQRRGGFFGGTGLTGFTGTGSGGLGGVGAATGFGRAGFGGAGGGGGGGGAGLAGGGAGTVGGFIGLLQQLQQIRNTEDSLALQLRTLSLLEAHLAAGVIDLTQVDQFRQNIETERANLLQSRNALEFSLDSFKTGTLGLPPNLPVQLDDTLIEQFQLVAPEATVLQDRIAALQQVLGELPDDASQAQRAALVEQAAEIAAALAEQLERVSVDLERLAERSAARESAMTEEERPLFERDKQLMRDAASDLNERAAELPPRLDALREPFIGQPDRKTISELVVWLSDAYRLVQESVLVQARARLESIFVDRIALESEQAFAIALENRLDLMNNRAALVDTWRLIQFNADALQSRLDVEFSGDMRTARNNPLSFAGNTGTLRVGLEFDAPFERLLERNNYRQALIDYQSDRRRFIQIRDGIHQSLRQTLRQLEQLRINLEIQRRAVAIAIRRVDLTREELNRPVPPAEPGQPAPQFGPTAALNLLTALSDLRNTQNNFMSVWLNYYATRMGLVRDLGIMVLDENGLWVDEPIDVDARGAGDLEELSIPPPVPAEWLDLADQAPAAAQSGDLRQPALEAGYTP